MLRHSFVGIVYNAKGCLCLTDGTRKVRLCWHDITDRYGSLAIESTAKYQESEQWTPTPEQQYTLSVASVGTVLRVSNAVQLKTPISNLFFKDLDLANLPRRILDMPSPAIESKKLILLITPDAHVETQDYFSYPQSPPAPVIVDIKHDNHLVKRIFLLKKHMETLPITRTPVPLTDNQRFPPRLAQNMLPKEVWMIIIQLHCDVIDRWMLSRTCHIMRLWSEQEVGRFHHISLLAFPESAWILRPEARKLVNALWSVAIIMLLYHFPICLRCLKLRLNGTLTGARMRRACVPEVLEIRPYRYLCQSCQVDYLSMVNRRKRLTSLD